MIRHRYSKIEPRKYGTPNLEPTMTQQQFKDECDVNNILSKYKKSGLLTHVNKGKATFGDFTTLEDYQTSVEKVMAAQDSFSKLPSEVRNRFQNDPGKIIDFLSDEKNHEEAVQLGLMQRNILPETLTEQFEKALENNDNKRKKSKKED